MVALQRWLAEADAAFRWSTQPSIRAVSAPTAEDDGDDGEEENEEVQPQLPCINPFAWTAGHVGLFYVSNAARWLDADLQRSAAAATAASAHLSDAEAFSRFDSMTVRHAARWGMAGGRAYYAYALSELRAVLAAEEQLGGSGGGGGSARTTYLLLYAIVHAFWHVEDALKTRQLLCYALPRYERTGE